MLIHIHQYKPHPLKPLLTTTAFSTSVVMEGSTLSSKSIPILLYNHGNWISLGLKSRRRVMSTFWRSTNGNTILISTIAYACNPCIIVIPLLPVITGTLRGLLLMLKNTGFCIHGTRKCVPSPDTVCNTPRNLSNITTLSPPSTTETQ